LIVVEYKVGLVSPLECVQNYPVNAIEILSLMQLWVITIINALG